MTAAAGTAREAAAVMPEQLKDKGWKLEQRTINDDETVYLAGNDDLALYTGRYADPDEAIEGAIILQSREDKNPLTPKQAKAQLKSLRWSQERVINSGEAPARDYGGFRPSPDADPLHPSLIQINGGTQPREELDNGLVLEYADAMTDGALFPAVTVFHDGKKYWLADGFHRFFAFKNFLGRLPKGAACSNLIQAEIHTGTQRDAVLFSLGANENHGKRRSAEDKRRAVLRLLEDAEWKQWSDSAIADVAKVSQPFVSSIRREIEKPAQASPSPLREKIERAAGTTDLERFKSPTTTRTTKAGKKIETKKIGTTARAKPAPKVDSWEEKRRKEGAKKKATLKWLLPACNESARLLVEKVEKANRVVTEKLATNVLRRLLATYDDFMGYGDEIAKRRGWKNSSADTLEKAIAKYSFGQLVGLSAEMKFWDGFRDWTPELDKKSIELLKQHRIDFAKVAAPFKEAVKEKPKARAKAA